jgi:hypothetical protein
MLDSLVRVSRRAAYDHYASILAEARTSLEARRITPWAITLRGATFPGFLSGGPKRCWPVDGEYTGQKTDGTPPTSLVASASLSTISRAF